ncbi:MAG: DUF4292 domain-containing protein [Prevotella sp.]
MPDSEEKEQIKMDFLRKVYDNEIYAKGLSSKIKFSISTEKNEFNVSGTLRMKKNEVIRIQLTPMGMIEAGRIEFTKEYVLLINRLNKEYVKARYDQIDFLNKNGLDFYSLQALFWNTLFVPGTQRMTDSLLKSFTVLFRENENTASLSLVKDAMTYQWTVDRESGCVNAVEATYNSKTYGKTIVECKYDNFKPLCGKQFPLKLQIRLQNNEVKSGGTMTLGIVSGDFDTDLKWETFSSVSDKYKAVSVQSLMNRLLGL